MPRIIPAHEQIAHHRHHEDLDLLEDEIHQRGTEGIAVSRLANRARHYHGLDDNKTEAIVDELVSTGRVERVRDLLRSTANGWTTRSHVLRQLGAHPHGLTETELVETHPRGAGLRAVRNALYSLGEDDLAARSPRGDHWHLTGPQGVSQAALATALGLDPRVPTGVLLRAVRAMADGVQVMTCPPSLDELAEALDCRPAPIEVMLAVARDRQSRAWAHDQIIRETVAAIEGLGLSPEDDHPAQVISQLAARLRRITELATVG